MNAAERKLRDQFALASLGSMTIDPHELGEHGAAVIAATAYEIADALIAERRFEPDNEREAST